MRTLEDLLSENNLSNPEDIDSLLELADITRRLIRDERYSGIELLISYLVGNDYYDAFSWVMAELQEELEKPKNSRLKGFTCFVCKSVPNYSEFIRRLQVDPEAIGNDAETITDHNGEVQSFFNILTYKTAYGHIFLVTEENFDTKDNDFIRYKLKFTK